MSWEELSSYFNYIYTTEIKSVVFKYVDPNYINDYIYYEKNISNHFRSGIPYILGNCLGVNKKDIRLICATSEMSYCFSLILDDVIDNDYIRWGKDTTYKLKGGPYTVALSTYLNSSLDQVQPFQLLNLRLLHNKWLFKSFLLEQKLKTMSNNLYPIDTLNEILLLKTTSGIIANLMMVELSTTKYKTKLFKYVFEYSAYTGITGQLKDDVTDISKNNNLKQVSRNSDIKNNYVNYITLHYSKEDVLQLIKFSERKAIFALNKVRQICPMSDKQYNYLLQWSKVAYERTIDAFEK